MTFKLYDLVFEIQFITTKNRISLDLKSSPNRFK